MLDGAILGPKVIAAERRTEIRIRFGHNSNRLARNIFGQTKRKREDIHASLQTGLQISPGSHNLALQVRQVPTTAVEMSSGMTADLEASRLVMSFHYGLAAGLPPAEALRRAQVEAMEQGVSPATWAAFQLWQ